MPASDDAFLRFLLPLSGRTIGFLPGTGGFDDALNSLALFELCDRHRVACEPLAEAGSLDEDVVVVGSMAVASRCRARLAGRTVVVLPGSALGFDGLEDGLGAAATVFWRDRVSLRMAELQGGTAAQGVLCHDLAVHLDVAALVSGTDGPGPGVGTDPLTLDVDARNAASAGDRIRLQMDGAGGRWGALERCRDAVRGVACLLANRTEIRTDSPSVAILAAKMGKAARLSGGEDRITRAVFNDTILPLFPAVTLEPGRDAVPSGRGEVQAGLGGRETAQLAPSAESARLKALLAAARREAQFLTQERDQLFIMAADLRTERDSETVAVVRSCREAKDRAERRTAECEAALAAAEGRCDELAARLAGAQAERDRVVNEAAASGGVAELHDQTAKRLARSEARLAATEARRGELTAQLAAARAERDRAVGEAAARAVAGREAAAREAELRDRLDELNAAFDLRTRQALDLQRALDETTSRAAATAGTLAQMRGVIEARTAMGEEARRDAEARRQELGLVLSSTSWRVTRFIRAIAGVARGAAGDEARGRHA